MGRLPENFYAEWRLRGGAVLRLGDDADSPPEKLLQAVWQHQRVLRDKLKLADGRSVRVLHPGFHSAEGGPDFRGAVVQFGDEKPRSGDVELDLRASGWHAHGHDRNPAFAQVILHVLWEGDQAASGGPPALSLRGALDAPLGELSLWLSGDPVRDLPEAFRGKCSGPLQNLGAEELAELLRQAALTRLQSKAAQFSARARQVGWEQSLWEGLFRALGYKNNTWPMQRLAELRPQWYGGNGSSPKPLTLQARLLGLSGLLPVELTRQQKAADDYLRQVWDLWWRERDQYEQVMLPRTLWRMHGLRPANNPQRRLALAAQWSATAGVVESLENWCAEKIPEKRLAGSLLKILQGGPDDYWSWHWTIRSPRLAKAQPLLGAGRVTDLAINVILPWLWIRAKEGKSAAVLKRVEQRYFAWPAAEDNSVLRLARKRLLGGAAAKAPNNAATQQGLIQIVRDFCDHSNAVCDACRLPEMIGQLGSLPSRP